MGYYIKVTKEVASELLPAGVKPTKTKDDNCLLWQSELNGVDGINLAERCKTVGGALLTERRDQGMRLTRLLLHACGIRGRGRYEKLYFF